MRGNGNWNENRRLILSELERFSESLKDLTKEVSELKKEVSILKTQSTIWGAIGGFIISTIVTIAASIISSLI